MMHLKINKSIEKPIKNRPYEIEDDLELDDSQDENEKESNENEGDDSAEQNKDWAKSIAKVLKQEKPKHKKSIVLSKFKQLPETKKQDKISFEIDGSKTAEEIKEEKPDVDELNEKIEKKVKKNKTLELRVKPYLMDLERERTFKKIAAKGVVQLFNAVRSQQKDLAEQLDEAGKLDHKRDAVLNNINKRKFLDVLMGGKRSKSEMVDNHVKDEDESDYDDAEYNDGLPKNSIWSVLKKDFMTNKKLTHWDKNEEEENKQKGMNDSDSN